MKKTATTIISSILAFLLPIVVTAAVLQQNQVFPGPYGNGIVYSSSTTPYAQLGAITATSTDSGKLLQWNGVLPTWVATSTLGITGGGGSYSATFPLTLSGTVLGLAFGTTTANSWSGLQQFNGNASTTQLSISGTTYLGTNSIWNSTGVVGIGTLAPDNKLHIYGGLSGATSTLVQLQSAANTANTGTVLQFTNSTASGSSNGGGTLRVVRQADSSGNFVLGLSAGGSSVNDYLTVLGANGNIGSGTTTPTARLTVLTAASSTPNLLLTATTGGGCIIVKDTGGTGYTELYTQSGALLSKVATSITTCN